MFTLGDWIFIGFWVICTIGITLGIAAYNDFDSKGWLGAAVNFFASMLILVVICMEYAGITLIQQAESEL